MINYIWSIFIVVGVFYSILKGDSNLTNNLLTSGNKSVDMIIGIIPLMCLWMGVMELASKSGLLDIMAKKLSRIVRIIFPDIPKDDKVISYISSNIVMNMMGLGNAATPFGLKAMEELDRLNNNSKVASRSMITFLVINTASVTILPSTVISLRMVYKSNNPSSIIMPCIIATFLSTLIALLLDRLFYHIWGRV